MSALERVRALYAQGMTQASIARETGFSPQYVNQLVNREPMRMRRMGRLEIKRRSEGKRTYECGVCGERGHNARRHRSD